MTEATPRPWKADKPLDMEGMRHIFIKTATGAIVGRIDGHFRDDREISAEEAVANADLVVRATYAHDELVEALRNFVDYYDQAGMTGDDVDDDADEAFDGDEKFNVRRARAALAKAEGKHRCDCGDPDCLGLSHGR